MGIVGINLPAESLSRVLGPLSEPFGGVSYMVYTPTDKLIVDAREEGAPYPSDYVLSILKEKVNQPAFLLSIDGQDWVLRSASNPMGLNNDYDYLIVTIKSKASSN